MRLQILATSLVTILFVIVYNEFIIYYVYLWQCDWPRVDLSDKSVKHMNVMFISDIHILPDKLEHILDTFYHEHQMYRSFKTAIELFQPEFIFVLGDIFQGGEYATDEQFNSYIRRYKILLELGSNKSDSTSRASKSKLYTIVGNHDIGFHYTMNFKFKTRFDKAFNTDSVQLIRINDINFVTLNSITMEGDYCGLCADAEHKLANIAKELCPQTNCDQHNRPILLTHFPLFRESDQFCDEVDSAPNSIKFEKFVQKWDCLSDNATKLLMKSLKPRLIVNGHTHYGCVTFHENHVQEWTVPSFSWRNTNNPSFLLVKISTDSLSISKCILPNQVAVILVYVITFTVIAVVLLSKIRRFRFRSRTKLLYSML